MVLRIGIIGCGNIAGQYVKGLQLFPDDVHLLACADLIAEKAQDFAQTHAIRAVSVENLLQSEEIDIILNLTNPAAHAEVSLAAIKAGKHIYSEKPLALTRADGQSILETAKAKGLRVGCAPDTFLGAGGQTCRQLIDQGEIGKAVSAVAFFANHGHESWHPNPVFYYAAGGGPMLDMGPYYLTALVNLLGPIKQVAAFTARALDERIAKHPSIQGQKIPVTINTHLAGIIEFEAGQIATVITSFDIWQHHLPRIEIYGTEGTIIVPDPNIFGGEILLWQADSPSWQAIPLQTGANFLRGVGVADMARAIQTEQAHRASGELAFHILDAMLAFEESSSQQRFITLSSQIPRPEPMPS